LVSQVERKRDKEVNPVGGGIARREREVNSKKQKEKLPRTVKVEKKT